MRLPVPAAHPAPAPESEAPLSMDALSLATRLRVNRENLASHQRDVDQSIAYFRTTSEQFDSSMRLFEEARRNVPMLEQALKDLARDCRQTLDLGSQGVRVKFSNPSKKTIDFRRLVNLVPSVEEICPDAVVRKVEVDVKVIETAVAAGVLPSAVLRLIEKIATTGSGRVELEYVDPI